MTYDPHAWIGDEDSHKNGYWTDYVRRGLEAGVSARRIMRDLGMSHERFNYHARKLGLDPVALKRAPRKPLKITG